MVRVWLGRSLRAVDLGLFRFVTFRELLDYIGRNDVELDEVKRLIEKVDEDLKGRGSRIEIRKSLPWDRKADYRLVLR